MSYYNPLALKSFCQHVFEKLMLPPASAAIAADVLIRANLEGVDSHGISRLPIYAQRIRTGRINAVPQITVEKKGDSVLLVHGDNGLGQIVATKAVQEGIILAKKSGTATVAVRQSNHFGSASYYSQMACEQGMALIGLTNSPPGIPPWGGKKAFLGTNPISFGFPTGSSVPIIIDMSSSVVARGKIMLAAKQGKAIPKGWAIDEQGRDTENAKEALHGAVLPFGGAKGYALALAIEILTGVLSGAAFGPRVKSMYAEHNGKSNVGHFFILFDIETFMPLEQFSYTVNQLLKEIKSVPLAEGFHEILYPGERRAKEYRFRLETGIPLPDEVEQELLSLGEEAGVKLPSSIR